MLRREHWELSGPAWVVFLARGMEAKELGVGRCLGPCGSVIPGHAVSVGTLQGLPLGSFCLPSQLPWGQCRVAGVAEVLVLRQTRLVISQLCLHLASASLSLSLSFLMCPGSNAPTPQDF